MKAMRNWMTEEGELKIVSPSQARLAQTDTSQLVFAKFRFFKEKEMKAAAQEIREHVNNAMEIAYERDTGFTSQNVNLADTLGRGPGF